MYSGSPVGAAIDLGLGEPGANLSAQLIEQENERKKRLAELQKAAQPVGSAAEMLLSGIGGGMNV